MNTMRTLKFSLLVLLIISMIVAVKFTSLGSYLNKEDINSLVESSGYFAPLVFVLIFGLGTAMFLPGSIFIAIGAYIFGTIFGTALNVIGHMLGAIITFYIVRTLGHDFVKNLKSETLKKYNKLLHHHGFATVFYLRLCFCPFAILNTAAGLSSIRFRSFLLGTTLGVIPTTFVLTYFFDVITNISTMSDLLQPQVGVSALLVGCAFLLPRLLRRLPKDMKKRYGLEF